MIFADPPGECPPTQNLGIDTSDVQGGEADVEITGDEPEDPPVQWDPLGTCIDEDPLLMDVDGADDVLGTADDNVRLSEDSPRLGESGGEREHSSRRGQSRWRLKYDGTDAS